MVLILGVPAAIVLGLVPGSRRVRIILLALIWYVCLAAQTAYLAAPGRTGFGGVDGNAAIQFDIAGGGAAWTYWPLQPVLAILLFGVFTLADRLVRGDRTAT